MGKGSDFERQVCVLLSKWWTSNKRDDIFWRSSNSGGRATVRGRKGRGTFGQYGDVQATDPIGQPLIDLCTIELKRGRMYRNIYDLLDQGPAQERLKASQPFELCIEQAIREALEAGTTHWMLIARRDGRQSVLFIPWGFYSELLCRGALPLAAAGPQMRFVGKCRSGKRLAIFGCPLSEFLRTVKPEHIVRGTKRA